MFLCRFCTTHHVSVSRLSQSAVGFYIILLSLSLRRYGSRNKKMIAGVRSVKNVLGGNCHALAGAGNDVIITCCDEERGCHSRWSEPSLSVWHWTHSINDWAGLTIAEEIESVGERVEWWQNEHHEQHSARNAITLRTSRISWDLCKIYNHFLELCKGHL